MEERLSKVIYAWLGGAVNQENQLRAYPQLRPYLTLSNHKKIKWVGLKKKKNVWGVRATKIMYFLFIPKFYEFYKCIMFMYHAFKILRL